MYFSSPTSNITPAMVSTAMTRSDSRDSTSSACSFTSTPAMQVSYSTSPSTYRSSSISSTRGAMSIPTSSTGWLPSPYRSCMLHRNSSSQGYNPSTSSYISDDDLLALDDLTMPPIEYISSPTSAPRQPLKREMTTEEQIAMLRDMQEREQDSSSKSRAQQQRTVRFAAEQQKKTRRVSGASQRRSTTTSTTSRRV